MPPQKFPFITDGIHGRVPVNLYPAADSEREVILQPDMGLLEHCQLPDCTQVREVYAWDNYLYALAQRGSQAVLWKIDDAGGYAEIGTVTTSASGPAWMKNNPTQLCVVDGVCGYVYSKDTGLFTSITDLAFLGASGMDYLNGYRLFLKPD